MGSDDLSVENPIELQELEGHGPFEALLFFFFGFLHFFFPGFGWFVDNFARR